MKKIKHSIDIWEYDSPDELSAGDREVLQMAMDASTMAYAPYSKYYVGAAVLLGNGLIVKGNNQENVAYPSGLCAERVALFHASANYPDEIVKTIAITAKADGFEVSKPVTPCGSCRQVMAEMENRQSEKIRIIMMGNRGTCYVTDGVENLLPLMFKADELKKS